MRRPEWSVVRAQYFEQFCRLVRDGIHQTLAVLFHVVFSLEQSKKLELSYIPVQIAMCSLVKVFKLSEHCNLLLDPAQYALRKAKQWKANKGKANKMAIWFTLFFTPFSTVSLCLNLQLIYHVVPILLLTNK